VGVILVSTFVVPASTADRERFLCASNDGEKENEENSL
jgi:hypothetical protein